MTPEKKSQTGCDTIGWSVREKNLFDQELAWDETLGRGR